MKMMQSKMEYLIHKKVLFAVFGFCFLTFILSVLSAEIFGETRHYQNLALHAGMETAGAIFALMVAYLLVRLDAIKGGSRFNCQIVIALLVMGVLDGLHALQPVGHAFIWLHSIATAFGGLLFAAILLPASLIPERGGFRVWAYMGALAAAALALWALVFPERLPEMAIGGQFTLTAVLLNVGGGVLLLMASIRLLFSYFASAKPTDLLLCLQCGIFGLAAVMFEYSTLWDVNWWIWHVLRLIGYVTGLWLVNALLEISINEKSSSETQLSKKLERDRDAMLSTLNLHAIVSIANRAGDIVEVNDAFCRISGYSRQELIGNTHRVVNSGVQPPEFWVSMWHDISKGLAWRGEVCNRAKDGSLYWVDTVVAPFVDDDGDIERYISIRTDITASKKSAMSLETALRDSQALLGTLNLHAIVSIANPAGDIVEVNDAFCQISGYTRAELIGKNHRIVNSGVQPPAFWVAMWKTIAAGMSWRGQVCNCSKDGSRYWVDTFIAPFIDEHGKIEKYISIRTDITASKQAEEALRWNQSLMQMMSNSSPLAFLVIDNRSDEILYFNRRFCEIWGIEHLAEGMQSGQLKNRDIVQDCLLVLADVSGFSDSCQPLQDENNRITLEDEILFSDERVIRRFTTQIRDADDKYYGRFYIFEDITAQKQAERHLTQASEAAKAASLAKSQFLANMSHELRTPMNAVLGMLTLLRKTELSARQADYANKSDSAARSLLSLLNEILDFSKIEAGKMALDCYPFSLEQLMHDLAVILASNVGAKQLEILFDIDPKVPAKLLGDAMRLQQVLINLSSNAIKFTASGEVVLSVEVLHQGTDEVLLKFGVRDSGIGIAPENQSSIFNGFTQAEASTTRRFGGTGLGLAISQHFVTLMGGKIELESELGHGSCFHFTIALPLQASLPSLLDELSLPGSDSREQHWHALIVDDNPSARDILARMGRSLGWQVDVAESGTQALEILADRNAAGIAYQAVFLDWQMPGMDGWETCQHMQDLGLPGQPPVVVMVTAHDREMLEQRSAREQDMLDGFLVKPVTASMLFNAVIDARAGIVPLFRKGAANGERRLPGMRVLVAEDNLNNQQVVRELLEGKGAMVQIVNHGQEAIDAILAAQSQFDVVLMDLQMPVMDGLTASKYLRNELGLQSLPIVAMTANAMESDRQACLEAGMNEHVGKPFDLDHLVKILRQQAGLPEMTSAPPLAGGTLPSAVVHAAKKAHVELAPALNRLGDKLDVYQRLLRSFIDELALLPEQFRLYLKSEDLAALSRALHTLKGLSGTLGMQELSNEVSQADQRLRESPQKRIAETLVQQICHSMEKTVSGLPDLLRALESTQKSAQKNVISGEASELRMDATSLLAALRIMSSQLENSDMAAIESMINIRLHADTALAGQLLPMEDAVNALDFERALSLCDTLMASLS
jgi:PAS domain S-box-containing protein